MDIRITTQESGMEVRSILQVHLHPSHKLFAKLKFTKGNLLLNHKPVNIRAKVSVGDLLTVVLADTGGGTPVAPCDLPLTILYEDESLLVLDKPAGMMTHPTPGHMQNTLAGALQWHFQDTFVFRPLGRLDRDTSGCVLCAKNQWAAGSLDRCLKNGEIAKEYLALVDGIPCPKQGEIVSGLCLSPDGKRSLFCPPDTPGAKMAQTQYRVLDTNDKITLVLAKTITGRMHQIRAQMAGIGTPLLGDALYGNTSPLLARHALHAWRMTFPLLSGNTVAVCASLPADFAALLQQLGFSFSVKADEDSIFSDKIQ